MLPFEEAEQALRTSAVAAETQRDILVAEGPEASSYLHGQLSQNVDQLAEGTSAWSLLLEPTGRVTGWGRITRVGPEAFWIDFDPGTGEAVLARLERFKLGTKATFDLRTSVPTVAVRGPQSPQGDDLRRAAQSAADTIVADVGWPGTNGADLLAATLEALGPALEDLGVALVSPDVIELERVEAGRPAMGAEFGEKTIPAETGVVDRSADFAKGCYVGQELVARIDSRGNNTPRRVHPVRLAAGTVPAIGDELRVDGESVGVFTSVAAATDHVAALASVKRGVEAPAAAVVTVDGNEVPARIEPIHWA